MLEDLFGQAGRFAWGAAAQAARVAVFGPSVEDMVVDVTLRYFLPFLSFTGIPWLASWVSQRRKTAAASNQAAAEELQKTLLGDLELSLNVHVAMLEAKSTRRRTRRPKDGGGGALARRRREGVRRRKDDVLSATSAFFVAFNGLVVKRFQKAKTATAVTESWNAAIRCLSQEVGTPCPGAELRQIDQVRAAFAGLGSEGKDLVLGSMRKSKKGYMSRLHKAALIASIVALLALCAYASPRDWKQKTPSDINAEGGGWWWSRRKGGGGGGDGGGGGGGNGGGGGDSGGGGGIQHELNLKVEKLERVMKEQRAEEERRRAQFRAELEKITEEGNEGTKKLLTERLRAMDANQETSKRNTDIITRFLDEKRRERSNLPVSSYLSLLDILMQNRDVMWGVLASVGVAATSVISHLKLRSAGAGLEAAADELTEQREQDVAFQREAIEDAVRLASIRGTIYETEAQERVESLRESQELERMRAANPPGPNTESEADQERRLLRDYFAMV